MNTGLLPLVLQEETAVLLRWQKHCHCLAVELRETLAGWEAAASWIRRAAWNGTGGLFDVVRGPYPSRESAIRNSVAHLVHHALHTGMRRTEAIRCYKAAGIPIPRHWEASR